MFQNSKKPISSSSIIVLAIALSITPKSHAGFFDNVIKNASEALNSAGTAISTAAENIKNSLPEPQPVQEEKVPQSEFTLSNQSETHPYADLSGKMLYDNLRVWIQVKKADSDAPASDFFVIPQNREFTLRVHFPNGPGKYDIRIRSNNKDEPKFDTTYRYEGALTATNLDQRDFSFLLPSEQVQSEDPAIVELSQRITKGAKTAAEKSRAIHDWVARNISYDVLALESPGKVTKGYPVDAMTVLTTKKSVCEGYSTLMAALHRAQGIRAKVVVGLAIDKANEDWSTAKAPILHAWNEIYFNKRWVTIDTTWNAGFTDGRMFVQRLTNTYFDMAPEIFAEDHKKSNDSPV